jgi:hypothetical protein
VSYQSHTSGRNRRLPEKWIPAKLIGLEDCWFCPLDDMPTARQKISRPARARIFLLMSWLPASFTVVTCFDNMPTVNVKRASHNQL